MSKSQRNQRSEASPPPAGRGLDPMSLATLAGTIAILVISFSNMRSIDRLASDVGQLESELDRVGDRAAQAPAQPQPAQDTPPRQRRPDPDKIHDIKTANAPARGPATAPVVIAEFSDFQ